jgi:hypothetical protein
MSLETVPINFSAPATFRSSLDEAAKAANMTRSEFIRRCVEIGTPRLVKEKAQGAKKAA